MSQATLHLLLIEDNPGDVRLIYEMLRDLHEPGFALETADTLKEGLQRINEKDFDAILLDLSLSDSFGVDTLRRAHAHAPQVPFIVLTGFAHQSMGIEAVQAGAQDYLVKGTLNGDLLSRAIYHAVERHRIEMAEREQRLLAEAMRDVLKTLSSTLVLDEVMERILANIGDVVPHDAAYIFLIEQGRMIMAGQRSGDRRGSQADTRTVYTTSEYPTLFQALRSGDARLVQEINPDEHGDVLNLEPRIYAFLLIPIQLRSEKIGLIVLCCFEPGFTPRDVDRLRVFAEQAAIAIQNARLFARSQELATHEERARLARELHDSISQTLFTANVIAESAVRQWETNPNKVRGMVRQLHQLTSSALAEMRVLLLELRPSTLEGLSLKQLIEQLVQSSQGRKPIGVAIEISELPEPSPEVKVALYRIMQEAFNNIQKHSMATEVAISAAATPDGIELQVRDNGRGFEPDNVSMSSLGLGIMRERAELIGAAFEVMSEVGQGTQIKVRVPVAAYQG